MSFDRWTDNRRTTRLVLMGIIVLTLPCYCLGVILLATSPQDEDDPTAIPANSTLGGITSSPESRETATSTPFRTSTVTPFGNISTPTQYYLVPSQVVYPTAIPTNPPPPTTAPTITTASSLTPIPTNTLPPSQTPVPTDTLPPTDTPLPTDTPVPTDTTAPPTAPPKPSSEPPEPTPTQEKLNDEA